MRLKDLREDADLTQSKLAEFLHIKQNSHYPAAYTRFVAYVAISPRS